MKRLTKKQLNKILDLHKKWTNGKTGGQRADLSGVDLTGADLREANLSRVDLSGAYLVGANLTKANLSGADLKGSDLRGAYLVGANLTKANLSGANLSRANLSGANLTGVNLSGTNLSGTNLTGANLSWATLIGANLSWATLIGANLTNAILPDFQIPQDVDLEVWKKIKNYTLVKLKIPKEAKRTACLINNKCRAEYAEVLEIIGKGRCSIHDENFIYEVGKVVKPDSYNNDIREDCMPGIHFFMTKEEAEEY